MPARAQYRNGRERPLMILCLITVPTGSRGTLFGPPDSSQQPKTCYVDEKCKDNNLYSDIKPVVALLESSAGGRRRRVRQGQGQHLTQRYIYIYK